MTKITKIIAILVLICWINTHFSYAETTNLYNDIDNQNTTTNTETDDHSTQNTTSENTTDDTSSQEDNQADDAMDSYAQTSSPSSTNRARINTLSSVSEANLGLNNILCIILIALGILMILLAIAILIRLKK